MPVLNGHVRGSTAADSQKMYSFGSWRRASNVSSGAHSVGCSAMHGAWPLPGVDSPRVTRISRSRRLRSMT